MKITVVSHITIDHIQSCIVNRISIGGSAYYSGLMIKLLFHDINLVTKIGTDFDHIDMLSKQGLIISDNCITAKPTTRFKIVLDGNRRKLFLLARCADITVDDVNVDTDACIISPIIYEVGSDVIRKMSKLTNFIFIDPQGFLRKVRHDGSCYVDKSRIDFSKLNIDVIKVDREEVVALTGLGSTDALYKLHVRTAIMTTDNRTFMLHNQRLYEIITDVTGIRDSTGAGDIFAGAYVSAFMQNHDVQWALCYGVAAAVLALRTNKVGIEKIPCRKEVEEYASVLHNKIKTLPV